jgi:hypothetical protein
VRPGDGWYGAVGADIDARESADRRPLFAPLTIDRGARPRQSAQWRLEVHDLGRHRWAARALPRMLEALAEAAPLARPGSAADGRPLLVAQQNTACAVNLIWAAVEIDLARGTQTIGRILLRSVAEPWIMDSARVRNACANALAEIGSSNAVDLLVEATGLAPTKAVRAQLLLCADRATGHGEQSPSRRAELHVPNHGLDSMGRRELAVRHHVFELELLQIGYVCVTQLSGEATRDDAARRVTATEARAIRATYRKEVARIEALLATERQWMPEEWRRIYQDNPITRAVASRLIWRHTYEDGRVLDQIPPWHRERVVSYPAEGTHFADPPPAEMPYRISLWHPSEAEPALLATWRETCRKDKIVQPFEQVKRNFTRHAPDSDATELAEHTSAVVEADRFAATVRRLDWHSRRTRAAARSDAIRLAFRDFPDDHVSLVLPYTDSADPADPTETVVLGAAWFHRSDDRARTPLPLGAIAPRVYSEAVRDLSLLAIGSLVTDAIPDEADDEFPDGIEQWGNGVPEDEIPDRLG